MRKVVLSLVVFGVAALLSSALPPEKENGARRGIAGPGASDKKFLSKRKPPGKVPGPQLVLEDDKSELRPGSGASPRRLTEEEGKKKNTNQEGHILEEEKDEGKAVLVDETDKEKKDADKIPIKTEDVFRRKPGD